MAQHLQSIECNNAQLLYGVQEVNSQEPTRFIRKPPNYCRNWLKPDFVGIMESLLIKYTTESPEKQFRNTISREYNFSLYLRSLLNFTLHISQPANNKFFDMISFEELYTTQADISQFLFFLYLWEACRCVLFNIREYFENPEIAVIAKLEKLSSIFIV